LRGARGRRFNAQRTETTMNELLNEPRADLSRPASHALPDDTPVALPGGLPVAFPGDTPDDGPGDRPPQAANPAPHAAPARGAAGRDHVDAWVNAAYRDLRRMARARLAAGGRNTVLDTTALVHESYLRLARARHLAFEDRLRFMSYAGHVMRSVIVDLVRERQAGRHGGDVAMVALTTQIGERLAAPDAEREILRVHEALETLAQRDARLAQVVELRYFAGMTEVEVAEVLQVTERTVRRDWSQARLFLADALA
jgi:RNA polymerase sigma factor (TIGR02999 family)